MRIYRMSFDVLILNIVLVRLWRVNPVKKVSLKDLNCYELVNHPINIYFLMKNDCFWG